MATLYEVLDGKAVPVGGGGKGGVLPRLHIVSEQGSTVTVTDGKVTLRPTEQSGVWECDVPTYGNWTIHSVNASGDVIATIYVDTVKIYNIDDSHFSATINVTYPDGATCSVNKGDQTYYATSNPYAFSVHSTGAWIVSATKDGTTESKTVNIISDGQSATVEILMASIKVTVADDFMGEVLNLTNGSDTKTWVIDGSDRTFAVPFGTWVATIEKGGKIYSSSEVEVSAYTLYELNVASYGFEGWLDSGRVTQTYASLDDVLADEKTLRQLFTIHNSVDYLVEWIENDNVIGQQILSNDYVAKWVNLRDYALDKLYDSNTCKAIMDSVDKYGYGEWVNNNGTWQPKGNVPIMTSNTAPYGAALCGYDPNTSNFEAYRAFNNNLTDFVDVHGGSTTDLANSWFAYKFTNPICPKKVGVALSPGGGMNYKGYKFNVEYSNDGTNWTPIASDDFDTTDADYNKMYYFNVPNGVFALYWRVKYITSKSSYKVTLAGLQFYGRELKVSVPKMTSNTEPFGEVKSSGNASSSYPAWYGFADGKASDGWMPNASNGWIQYDFGKPVVAKFVREASMKNGSLIDTNRASSMTVQGSNDGVTFTDIIGNISVSGSKHSLLKSFENQNPYKIYRISVVRVGGTDAPWLAALNFYCLDYSEKEFANDGSKWIYDHGVEVETLTPHTYGTGGNIARKDSNSLYLERVSSGTMGAAFTTPLIDMTPYNLERIVVGDNLYCSDSGSVPFALFATVSSNNYADNSWTNKALKHIPYSEYPNNAYVDIRNVQEECNGLINASQGSGSVRKYATITEWWLE